MSSGREITCNRIVFIDSEFDAKKGQGMPPGFPVCICAIEIDQHGREREHRLAAPYPVRPPWDHGDDDPYLTVGFALSAEAGCFLHVPWGSLRSTSMRRIWQCQTRRRLPAGERI